MIYSQKYNTSYDNKLNMNSGNKKYSTNNYRQNTKSYNKQPSYNEPTFDYFTPSKKTFQYEKDSNVKGKFNKMSNSGYSTMASEGDQEPELAGFKVVQSGKILFDVQSSDSDSSASPFERKEVRKEQCYASATNFLGPAPVGISLPSFF